MDDVKIFADAGSVATLQLLDAVDNDTLTKINQALAAGGRLSIALLVDHEGGSEVTLELLQDDKRVPIATVKGKNPSVSH